MSCPYIPDLPYSDFRTRLRQKLGEQRLPLSGSLELNFRCNLRCKHCYVAHGHTGIPGKQELSLSEIQRIIDELVEAGCLWLLLTGGEILMRRDFVDIYLYAKRKGLLVTLFTNATLLTPRLADLLAEYRPFNLEITLYGWTQETYERVTGIPGSHRRCYQGIQYLVERAIPFRLKTVLMTLNYHELDQMRAFAEGLGVNFRYDPLINGGIESCGGPLAVRLSPTQVLEIDRQDLDFGDAWLETLRKHQGHPISDSLYVCSAGKTSFHIDPYGQLSMCLTARQESYDLRQGSFKEGWEVFLKEVRAQKVRPNDICHQCELRAACSACPGWSYTEHGDSQAHVDYLCQVTHLRQQAFQPAADLLQVQLPADLAPQIAVQVSPIPDLNRFQEVT